MLSELLSYIASKRSKKSIFWRAFFRVKDKLWSFFRRIKMYFVGIFEMNKRLKGYRQVQNHSKISFCITCMNRLCHLEKTLFQNINNNISYPNIEFVLLDYNSRDGLQDWVNKKCKKYIKTGILKYHRIEGPKYFHMAHAKNTVHFLATGDVVCGLDADNFTNKDFAFYINYEFSKDKNVIGHCSGKRSDFGGRMFLSKENFIELNGYDENFIGWGYEDLDFKHRAFEKGLTPISIPDFFLNSIQHSDELRYINMSLSCEESLKRNKALFAQKRREVQDHHLASGKNLP